MIPVLDARAMRLADADAIRGGTAGDDLMENAAAALCGQLRHAHPGWRSVAVVCGPGNNGGDGLAAARMLALSGISVSVFTLRDPSSYAGDAARNAERARSVGLSLVWLKDSRAFSEMQRALADGDGVIDALFGTGLTRSLEGNARRAVAAINAAHKPVLSADLPSGLSADSGALLGPAVHASQTVGFGAPKPCHVLPPASGLCGRVVVADIGISRETLARRATRFWILESADILSLLPARPLDSHKADFGRLAVIAGSRGKAGAAILAARGALRGGAGLVTVFCAESLTSLIVGALPEAMTFGLPESGGALAEAGARALVSQLRGFDAAVVGPGLGTSRGTVSFLEALLRGTRLPLVVDADGLNAFAGRPERFARRRGTVVLTPHPGEAGRLLGLSSKAVQADRLGAARRLSRTSHAITILKGAHSLIASPSGEVLVNPTGTPLLSTAGSGDVLAGLIGALLAGGLKGRDAAMAGAWLHGAAAQALAPVLGDAGLLAHEVADAIPSVRAKLSVSRRRDDE
jgi:ADP-dependent NAD(P)H-hydrate dehydratase / NAD(P)H-hydrate epimerase